jgi:hypothetical protein
MNDYMLGCWISVSIVLRSGDSGLRANDFRAKLRCMESFSMLMLRRCFATSFVSVGFSKLQTSSVIGLQTGN